MEFDKKMCPIISVDGVIEKGKQFDIDIKLPEDDRNVIYGIIKDAYCDPIRDAVVKLIEIDGHERKPVSHTFTDKEGEFVFGPLCPDKIYELQVWANKVKHYKICAEAKREGKCLKGMDFKDCDYRADGDYRSEENGDNANTEIVE
ncbi:MAG: carboxypeptidase regulatory-like domain-containing protein [Clostridia bacterium]|nr:carboxypeptidase regulatory-like domain-containing protein [Clostridia bacterium]